MCRVFIIYSPRDPEIVDSIVEAMKHAGMNVWIDRQDIRAGYITGKWGCGSEPYEITLEVTIYDHAGHISNPVQSTMNCD